MPVVLSYNDKLDLNMVQYKGAVSLAELKALAAYSAKNPQHLQRDSLTVVLPGVDFGGVDLKALDALFARYRALFAPLDFQFLRRSAWLCFSPSAQPHVDYWIGGREMRESMSSAVRQFATFADAGDWLVLSEEEASTLESGEGFEMIVSYDFPAGLDLAR